MTTPSQVHVHLVLIIMLLLHAALQNVVLQAIPIPFSRTNCFQYWDVEEGSEPIWEFTRVNEIAEHIMILTHEQDHYGTYSL